MSALRLASAILATALLATGCDAGDAMNDAEDANASFPVFAMSTTSEEARKYVEEGERLADTGRFIKAYESFKRAVAADSAFAYGYLRVAQFGQSLDEFTTNLERAIAFKGTANETEKLLIEWAEKGRARDVESQVEISRRLVELNPNNPRAYWSLATDLVTVNQDSAGIAAMEKATALAPNLGASYLYLGSYFFGSDNRDLPRAEKLIQKGLELWPNEPLSYDFLGDLRRAQIRYDEAAIAYAKQVELEPDDSEGYNQMGHAHTFAGKYDEARAAYDNAQRRAKSNQRSLIARYRAFTAQFSGDTEKALAELQEVHDAIDGMNIPEPMGEKQATLAAIGSIAFRTNRCDLGEKAKVAREALARMNAEKINTPEFWRGFEANNVSWQGTEALCKKDWATMRAKAAEYMKIVEPDRNPNKNQAAHRMLGDAALGEKKYEEAIEHYNQAALTDMLVVYNRGLAYEGAGRMAEAKKDFETVKGYGFNNVAWSLTRSAAFSKLN